MTESDLIRAYRSVFTGPDGEAVLADIIERSGVYKSSFASTDVLHVGIAEGRRQMGVEIATIAGLAEPADVVENINKLSRIINERNEWGSERG